MAASVLLLLFTLPGLSVSAQTPVQRNDYRVQYAAPDRIFYSEHFLNTRDGGTVITGKIGHWEDSSKLFVMKIDRFGNPLWCKYMSNQQHFSEFNLCETSDGSIVFAGNSTLNSSPQAGNIFLYKFSCSGQLLWSKQLLIPGLTSNVYMRPYSLREGRNSDVILSVSNSSSASSDQIAQICRINASGDLVWSRSFQGYDQEITEYANSSFYVNGKIVVFGFKRISTNFLDYERRLFAMRLNYETGETELIRGYAYSEFATNYAVLYSATKVHFDVSQLSGNRFAIFGRFANGSRTEGYFFKMIIGADLFITAAQAYSVPVPLNGGWTKISVFPNGDVNIIGAIINDTTTNTNLFWYTTDSLNTVKKSLVFPTGFEVVALRYNVAQNGATGSNYAIGLASNVAMKYIVEAASFENADQEMRNCLQTRDTSVVKQVDFNPGYLPWTWTAVKTGTALITTIAAVAEDVRLTTTFLCKGRSYQPPGLSCNAALPVKLLTFTGEALSSGNLLQWTTEEQGDAATYMLQSSEDGLNFHDVSIQPVAPATGNRSYAYLDKRSYTADAVYYRLQTILTDGSRSFSKLLTMRRSAAVKQAFVYPNPARNTVLIATDFRPEKVEWFDVNGVRVKSVVAPETGQPLPVTDLPKGLYLVSIHHQGTVIHTKMIRN